jgi:formate dehydrogenase subunit gamma
MKKVLFFIITSLFLASAALAADSQIWGEMIISNILQYGKENSLSLGPLFTLLQSVYFKNIFLALLLGVPGVFLIHYLLFGPKVFSHDGEKIYIFTIFQRVIHLLAVIAFFLLVPTGRRSVD